MRKIIFTIIIILSAIATIVIFVFPSFQKLSLTQEAIEQKQQEIKELANYIGQIKSISEQLKGSEEQLAKIDQSLLQSSYLPSVFQFLQTNSFSSGVRIEKIELGRGILFKENKNIESQEVNLRVTGDYLGLKKFLTTLENSSRLILITGINFTGGQTSQDSTKSLAPALELNLKVFSYPNLK